MAKEIERKFLVTSDAYLAWAVGCRHIVQGYLQRDPERTVRVRLADGRGFLTVKGLTRGCERQEWEFEIPAPDARGMLALCPRVLDKTRWLVPAAEPGLMWEVDVFGSHLKGLTVAEIELPASETPFTRPAWLGKEVTDDPRYYNSALIDGLT